MTIRIREKTLLASWHRGTRTLDESSFVKSAEKNERGQVQKTGPAEGEADDFHTCWRVIVTGGEVRDLLAIDYVRRAVVL